MWIHLNSKILFVLVLLGLVEITWDYFGYDGITSDCIGLEGTISYQPESLGVAQALGIRGPGTSTVS